MKYFTPLLAYAFLLAFVPVFARAQLADTTWLDTLFGEIRNVLDNIVPVILAVGLALFIFGVIRYFIWGAADADSRTTARSYILYGLIGMVLTVAVWGIVNLLFSILGIGPSGAPPLPPL